MNSIYTYNCQSSIYLHLEASGFATIVGIFTRDVGSFVTKEMALVT